VKGSTPVADRQALMDEFNGDGTIPVLLLSTKACDLGNNLKSANVCIMHDLDCNTFHDFQADEYVRNFLKGVRCCAFGLLLKCRSPLHLPVSMF
jgi:Helicase conserved C-terminal domain